MNRINVVNPSGDIESIPQDQLADAEKQGYRSASADETKSFFEKEEFTSGAKPLLAGLAGAARALSFGASDVGMTAIGAAKPETLKGLQEHNPIESALGEMAGIGAAFLLPVPGTGPAAEAGSIARGARIVTAPVRAVSELGSATAAAVRGAESATALGRVAQTATSLAAGSAVEAGLYGLGKQISEHGLGDDTALNGESLLSHVGMSALLGGGIGGLLGAGGQGAAEAYKAFGKLFPGAPSPTQVLNEVLPEYGIIGQELDMAKRPAAERAAFEAAAARTKKNINEIEDAAVALGDGLGPAPVTDGMKSSSEHFQRIEQGIRNRGTPAGAAIQEQYNRGWQLASKKVDEALGPEVQESLATLGRKLKDGITEGFEQRIGPITQLYDEIHQALPHIDISNGSRKSMSRSIMRLAQSEGLTPSMSQYKYIKGVSDDILTVDNLQKLQNWRSALGKEVGLENKYIAGVVRDKLNDLEYRTIKGSLDLIEEPTRKEAISGLIDKIDQAKPAYRQLREEMGRVGKNVLGRKKIYGPQDFLDAIEDSKSVEGFAKSLLKRENSEFMGFMQKEFPNEFKEVMNYHKQLLREQASPAGNLNPRAAIKNIGKLEPEMRDMIFDQAQRDAIGVTDTYLKSFPENFNPSGTSAAEAYQRMFGIKGLGDAVAAWASLGLDAAQKVRLSSSVKSAEELNILTKINTGIVKTAKKIQSGSEAIFNESMARKVSAQVGSRIANSMTSHEDTLDLIAKINAHANNPELLIDTLGSGTKDIVGVAPQTTQGLQIAATRAIQYLALSAPEIKSNFPLGEDPIPSGNDLNIFAEKVKFIKDPTSVLQEVSGGTLVPEHLEILNVVYPKLYDTMKQSVFEQMTEAISKKKKINYRTKNMLSLFLNQDLDESITGQAIVQNQMAMMRSRQDDKNEQMLAAGNVKPTQAGLGKLDQSNQAMTSQQKSTQRIG